MTDLIERALQVQAQYCSVVHRAGWLVQDLVFDEQHGILCAEPGPETQHCVWVEAFFF